MESFLNRKRRHGLIPNRQNAFQNCSDAFCSSVAAAVNSMECKDLTLFFFPKDIAIWEGSETVVRILLFIHLINPFKNDYLNPSEHKHVKTIALESKSNFVLFKSVKRTVGPQGLVRKHETSSSLTYKFK